MGIPLATDSFEPLLERSIDAGPMSLILGDIDSFKAINHELGHDTGDAVLDLVRRSLEAGLPPGSEVARVGGDAFACLIPGAGPEDALIALESIRKKISGKSHSVNGRRVSVGMSFGIASFPQHGENHSELLNAAHEALHRAKSSGRGKASIYIEDKMVLKSNYYPRGQLARLSSVAQALGRTEASILRESLAQTLERYRDTV